MTLRLALGQLNALVGDAAGNVERVLESVGRARDASADLVLFPELVWSGYPPEDLRLPFREAGAGERTAGSVCAGGSTEIVSVLRRL